MPFDLKTFEAEVALKLIPTEQLPAVAQDAMEAGFDGPHVVRMAILEPAYGWAIDQALPPMLAELGCSEISPKEAALRLARERAKHLLETGEDPLPSLRYFYRLMWVADYPDELIGLGYLEDAYEFATEEEVRTGAREALEELLSPELNERRVAERKAVLEKAQANAKQERPYLVNSPTGRALLKERYKKRLIEKRSLLWTELFAWDAVGWSFGSWRLAVVGLLITLPIMLGFALWDEYRRVKRERRDILLRRGVPEDQI